MLVNHALKANSRFEKVCGSIVGLPLDLLTLIPRVATTPFKILYDYNYPQPVHPLVDLFKDNPNALSSLKSGYLTANIHVRLVTIKEKATTPKAEESKEECVNESKEKSGEENKEDDEWFFFTALVKTALEESLLGDNESQEILLNALRNVAEAQGGLGKLAKKTHLRREVLYRVLSPEGNPELRTFTSLIHAMGLNLRFC